MTINSRAVVPVDIQTAVIENENGPDVADAPVYDGRVLDAARIFVGVGNPMMSNAPAAVLELAIRKLRDRVC
jgi:hypothetical protein